MDASERRAGLVGPEDLLVLAWKCRGVASGALMVLIYTEMQRSCSSGFIVVLLMQVAYYQVLRRIVIPYCTALFDFYSPDHRHQSFPLFL